MVTKTSSAGSRILHNSAWIGLETLIETFVLLGSSIAVARYLGPEKLGYYSYINFFVSVVTRTSGNGLASATRKYMSEFLALDQPGIARAVYNLAYRYQLMGAVAITILGLASVLIFGDRQFRLMSSILILAILPGVMSWVPAQANNALEDVSQNTLSAIGYILSYGTVIILTIHFHWDLVGIASALLIGRLVEVLMRTAPLHARLRSFPLEPLTSELKLRLRNYCVQAFGIQLLMSIVWDRSEMFFLRAFATFEQIAFYSVSFGLVSNLLVVPRVFAGAAGITLMVESGRDLAKVDRIVGTACRYLLLIVFPLHLGAAAITREAVRFAYGPKYAGAVPVLIVAALLAIPRAFQDIPEILIRAADKQKQLLVWLSVTGVLNIALDAVLIPRFGSIGAAWGNGLSQAFAVAAVWKQAARMYSFTFPVVTALRFFAAASLMSAAAYLVGKAVPGLPGVFAAVFTAVPVYIVLIKFLHGLQQSDYNRLAQLGERLPASLRTAYLGSLAFVTPAEK